MRNKKKQMAVVFALSLGMITGIQPVSAQPVSEEFQEESFYSEENEKPDQEPGIHIQEMQELLLQEDVFSEEEEVSEEKEIYSEEICPFEEVQEAEAGVIRTTELAVPHLVSARSVNYQTIQIHWDPVLEADGYRIYRQTENGGWSRLIHATADNFFRDTTAVTGKEYCYTVRAYKVEDNGTVTWSEYDTEGITGTAYTQAPVLSIQRLTAQSARISWKPVEGAYGYRVYQKNPGGWQRLNAYTKENSYVAALVPGETGTFTVRAFRRAGGTDTFGFYDPEGIRITGAPAEPELKSVSDTNSGVSFSWNAAAGAEGYRVYRRLPGKDWIALTTLTGTSYTDTQAEDGTTYLYTVRAYCRGTEGILWSTYDKSGLSLTTDPGIPHMTKTTVGNSGITVSWNRSSGADAYCVYRKTEGSGWKQLGETTGSSYTDKTADANITYYYTARAYCREGSRKIWSDYENPGIKGSILLTAPVVSLKQTDNHSVTLSWKAIPGATGYRVYVKKGNQWTALVSATAKNTYTYDKLDWGLTTFTVKAYRSNAGRISWGEYQRSGYSLSLVPETPKLLSAKAVAEGLQITCQKTDHTDFYLFYRKIPGGRWETLGTSYSNSYTDKTAKKGVTYVYTVRAYSRGISGDTRSDFEEAGIMGKR